MSECNTKDKKKYLELGFGIGLFFLGIIGAVYFGLKLKDNVIGVKIGFGVSLTLIIFGISLYCISNKMSTNKKNSNKKSSNKKRQDEYGLFTNFKNKKDGNNLLINVTKMLKDNNIISWLDCGTLLGAIRENDFIKNDTDIDISTSDNNSEKVFSLSNNKEILDSHNLICVRQALAKKKEEWLNFQTFGPGGGRLYDVFSFKLKNNKNFYIDIYLMPWKPKLITRKFKNNIYYIPNEPEEYLKILYGDNWRIPSKNHANWDNHHRGVKKTTYYKNNNIPFSYKKKEVSTYSENYQIGETNTSPAQLLAINPPSDLIVSLTTIPSRINKIKKTLDSILNQDLKPRKIIINIPHYSIREKKSYIIPSFLQHNQLVEINRCVDYGPATKFIPTILKYKGTNQKIVVIDDDHIYPKKFLYVLNEFSNKYPNFAIGNRGWLIKKNLRWEGSKIIRSYELNKIKRVGILTGCQGYLIKSNMFNTKSLLNYKDAPKACFYMDDIWMSGQLSKNNIKKYVIHHPDLRFNFNKELKNTPNLNYKRMERNNQAIKYFKSYWNSEEINKMSDTKPTCKAAEKEIFLGVGIGLFVIGLIFSIYFSSKLSETLSKIGFGIAIVGSVVGIILIILHFTTSDYYCPSPDSRCSGHGCCHKPPPPLGPTPGPPGAGPPGAGPPGAGPPGPTPCLPGESGNCTHSVGQPAICWPDSQDIKRCWATGCIGPKIKKLCPKNSSGDYPYACSGGLCRCSRQGYASSTTTGICENK